MRRPAGLWLLSPLPRPPRMSAGHRSSLRLDPHSPGRWEHSAERDRGAVPVNGREQGKRGDPNAPTLHRPDLRALSPREGMRWQTTARITRHENNAGGQLSEGPTFDYRGFFLLYFSLFLKPSSPRILWNILYTPKPWKSNVLIWGPRLTFTDRRTKHLLPSL